MRALRKTCRRTFDPADRNQLRGRGGTVQAALRSLPRLAVVAEDGNRDGNVSAAAAAIPGKGCDRRRAGETYWKIFNGIRLTGMPGFSKTLSETQMWQMALLLANADKLPPAAKAALVAPVGANAATTTVPLVSPIPPAPGFPSSAPAK